MGGPLGGPLGDIKRQLSGGVREGTGAKCARAQGSLMQIS